MLHYSRTLGPNPDPGSNLMLILTKTLALPLTTFALRQGAHTGRVSHSWGHVMAQTADVRVGTEL